MKRADILHFRSNRKRRLKRLACYGLRAITTTDTDVRQAIDNQLAALFLPPSLSVPLQASTSYTGNSLRHILDRPTDARAHRTRNQQHTPILKYVVVPHLF
jgi:hypothetical protein